MEAYVEEDEHALRVMREEATEAYRALQQALAAPVGAAAGIAADQLPMRFVPEIPAETKFSIEHSALALGIIRL